MTGNFCFHQIEYYGALHLRDNFQMNFYKYYAALQLDYILKDTS